MRGRLLSILAILACVLLLTACPGGDSLKPEAGVWNQSKWNQATWQ